MTHLAVAVATGLYCGYVPVAPGTIGSVLGLGVFAGIRAIGSPLGEATMIIGLMFAACGRHRLPNGTLVEPTPESSSLMRLLGCC